MVNRCNLRRATAVPVTVMLTFLQAILFNGTDDPIKSQSDETQDTDRKNEKIQFEYLASVDDHVSQSFPPADKFADDDADQAEADVDFHGADDGGDAAWDDNFGQGMKTIAVQGVDQCEFVGIDGDEVRVKI